MVFGLGVIDPGSSRSILWQTVMALAGRHDASRRFIYSTGSSVCSNLRFWLTFDLDQIQRRRAGIIVNDGRSAVDAFAWIVPIILTVSAAAMFFIAGSLLRYVAESRNHPRTMDTHSMP
jgi:hypothetical protein